MEDIYHLRRAERNLGSHHGKSSPLVKAFKRFTDMSVQWAFFPETKGLALEDVDRLFTKPGFEEGFDAAVDEKDHISYVTDRIEKV